MTGEQTVDSTHYPRATRPGNRSTAPLPAGAAASASAKPSADMTQAKESRGASHIAVDTMERLLAVVVHSAGIQSRVGVRALLARPFLRFEGVATRAV